MTDTRAMLRIFYVVVFGIALVGSGQAATAWLNWWAPFAFLAVGAVEFGGAVLSMHADRRRQLGERALWSRLLSAGVAVGAVLVNWFGHASEPFQAAFFAGMSALGYLVWIIDTSARRRDALRRAGKLGETAPVYGVIRWLRHPWLTRRARHLALANPGLGLYGSLAAAEAAVRTERRQSALSKVLHAKIRQAAGPAAADIAVGVYDLDQVAARLSADADYTGLTAIIAAEVTPTAVTAARPVVEAEPVVDVEPVPAELPAAPEDDVEPVLLADLFPEPVQVVEVAPEEPEITVAGSATVEPEPLQIEAVEEIVYQTTDVEPVQDGELPLAPEPVGEVLVSPGNPPEQGANPKRSRTPKKATGAKKPGRPSTEVQIVAAFTRNPNTDVKRLARRLGVSERTIQRHRPKPVEPVTTTPNGSAPA